ncbi:MAG: tRNA (adenosine(37)-N6)-threonylcarbamoyltransferase complex transferase subunit TsaD [Hyphomicrobiales bacterium]
MPAVLGIETSCDETAAAVVRWSEGAGAEILADRVLSQIDEHAPFMGVVPEIAARSHLLHLSSLIELAMGQAGLDFGDLDAVAVTAGPGLIGGLLVGLCTAKAIALVHAKPLIAVNHLEGHALTPRMTQGIAFPYLLLLASGGHTQLLVVNGVGRYIRLGTTIDDALGEAFDKTAKLLKLGYPGGPAVERMAARGHAERFALPRPMVGRECADFSFSGLKTAVRRVAMGFDTLTESVICDICASFQAAVGDCIRDRVQRAMVGFRSLHPALSRPVLVVAGGVAANKALRGILHEMAGDRDFDLVVPPARLCTDNAAMIAWTGLERLACGDVDDLTARARARWPLDSTGPQTHRAA